MASDEWSSMEAMCLRSRCFLALGSRAFIAFNKQWWARLFLVPAIVLGLIPPQTYAQADQSLATPYKYIGNRISLKFHRPSCPYARVMSIYKQVKYQFRKDAVNDGQKPCRYCLPPDWTQLRGAVLRPPTLPPASEKLDSDQHTSRSPEESAASTHTSQPGQKQSSELVPAQEQAMQPAPDSSDSSVHSCVQP